jgi:hypothetical protein
MDSLEDIDRDVLAWSGWAISSEPQPITYDWPGVSSEESLPPQALHQLTPTRMVEVQISLPPYQYTEARFEVSPEQRHVDPSQCTERTEMAAQYSSSGCDDVVHSSQTRPASPITDSEGSSVEQISLDRPKRRSMSVVRRVPSPDPVEQIPPKETNLSPGALPSATGNGQRKPARPVGAVTGSKRGGTRADGQAVQQKRRFGEGSTSALKDGDGARTAKRAKLRAIHNSALVRDHHSVAESELDRRSSCSSSEDELGVMIPKPVGRRLVRPLGAVNTRRHNSRPISPSTPERIQTRRGAIPQGGSSDGRRQLQNHRAGSIGVDGRVCGVIGCISSVLRAAQHLLSEVGQMPQNPKLQFTRTAV